MRLSSRCAVAIVLVGHMALALAATAPAPPARNPQVSGRHSPYLAAQHPGSADINYALQWGIDTMQAHQTNSGNLIRFSYRVVDTNKAKVLIDKAAAPLMVSPKANVALQVPVMDKVGPLRQATELEAGKTYWMVFSNKGGFVKVGDRVSVLVGKFRVDGLTVQ
jgi:hypothetical protein